MMIYLAVTDESLIYWLIVGVCIGFMGACILFAFLGFFRKGS